MTKIYLKKDISNKPLMISSELDEDKKEKEVLFFTFGGLCSFVSYQEVKNESLYYQLRFLISKTRPSLTYSGREILIKELEKDFEMAVNSFISDVKEKWSLKNRIDALIGSIFIKPIENFVNWLKK